MAGFLQWDKSYIQDRFWFDGAALAYGVHGFDVDTIEDGNLIAIKTAAGTTILQRRFHGDKAPVTVSSLVFSFTLRGRDESEFYAFKNAYVSGTVVTFCPGIREIDVYENATATTYTLRRPLASTEVTDPVEAYEVYKNGVLTPAAASVSGQVVTVSQAGEIAIRYTPLFRVVVTGWTETVNDDASLDANVVLTEVIIADFGDFV